MRHLWIGLLAIFGIGQIADYCNALQNNLYYGNCRFDNNTMQIFTQVVVMDNPPPRPSPSTPVPAQKTRKWYDYIFHPFKRSPTTTTPPPTSSFGYGNIVNSTITFPPLGHPNSHLIKCIQVIDNITDGTGAVASIIEGGPNQNHTKIFLKSQPGGRINNKISIYAYRQPIQHTPPFGWKAPLYPPFPTHPNVIHQTHPQLHPQLRHRPHFP